MSTYSKTFPHSKESAISTQAYPQLARTGVVLQHRPFGCKQNRIKKMVTSYCSFWNGILEWNRDGPESKRSRSRSRYFQARVGVGVGVLKFVDSAALSITPDFWTDHLQVFKECLKLLFEKVPVCQKRQPFAPLELFKISDDWGRILVVPIQWQVELI